MANADHTPGDRLDDYLDDLVGGDTASPRDLDPDTIAAVRHFFASDDTQAPPRDVTARIWEDLMNSSANAGSIPFRPSLVAGPSSNGRAFPHQQRLKSLPVPSRRHWQWPLTQFATAALLLVTLGLGYLAFRPSGPVEDKPTTVPGVAASASPSVTQEATATAETISRAGHPLAGAWHWQDGPANSIGVFDLDGTYLEYSSTYGVGIGGWRPTGQRTAELVVVFEIPTEPLARDEQFGQEPAATSHEFRPGSVVQRMTVAVDIGGITLSATGVFELVNPDGTLGDSTQTGRAAIRQEDAIPQEDAISPESTAAEGNQETGIIIAQVFEGGAGDSRTPVEGACLVIVDPPSEDVCDNSELDFDPTPGTIEVSLPVGVYGFEVRAPAGYESEDQTRRRAIEAGQTTTLIAPLARSSQ